MTEDLAVEALLEFLNACEAGICAARERIKTVKGLTSYDTSKIAWKKAEGQRGFYEKSEDVDNLEFKALLKDLAAHDGKMSRDEYFYWTFQNGSTVGRKKRK